MSFKSKLALLALTALVVTAAAVKIEVRHSKAPYASALTVTTSQASASITCTGRHCVRPQVGIPYCSGSLGLNCTVRQISGGAYICTESLCSILPPIERDPE